MRVKIKVITQHGYARCPSTSRPPGSQRAAATRFCSLFSSVFVTLFSPLCCLFTQHAANDHLAEEEAPVCIGAPHSPPPARPPRHGADVDLWIWM